MGHAMRQDIVLSTVAHGSTRGAHGGRRRSDPNRTVEATLRGGAAMASADQQIDDGPFRVTKWTIPPGDEIPRHTHEFDYVVVPLVDSVMHVVSADGSEAAAEIRVGQSYARQAG